MKKFEKILNQHPRESPIEVSLTKNMLNFYPEVLRQAFLHHFSALNVILEKQEVEFFFYTYCFNQVVHLRKNEYNTQFSW